MRFPRLHLFELEDQSWFPATVRDLATDYLHFIETKLELHRAAVPLLADALRASGATQVVDLCSGGGGPIPALLGELKANGLTPRVTLTDRFPNTGAFRRVSSQRESQISFSAEPVDARQVPPHLRGLRTLFNSFHHFHPADAIAVLRDAASSGQPLAVFEIPERSPRALVSMLLLTPLMVLVTTPFVRPFCWRRLLWTYVLPLVPMTCWWDGIVSQLRAYRPEELLDLAAQTEAAAYRWSAGRVPVGTAPACMTYLIGVPAAPPATEARAVGRPLGSRPR